MSARIGIAAKSSALIEESAQPVRLNGVRIASQIKTSFIFARSHSHLSG